MDEDSKVPEIPENSWCGFPNEIRRHIASGLDNNTRLALRACSRRDKKLIDSIPWQKMEQLRIRELRNNRWKMTMRQTRWSYPETIKFQSFDELQEKLSEIIEKNVHIKKCWLWLLLERLPRALKLSKADGTPMRIRKLWFVGGGGYAASILKQVQEGDHVHICGISEEEVFDMKQIIHAKTIFIEDSCVQLHQLSAMKATWLGVHDCRDIKLAEINEFIEERFILLETNNEMMFEFKHRRPIKNFDEVLKGFHSNVEISEQTAKKGKAKLLSAFRHDLGISYSDCEMKIHSIDSNRAIVNIDDKIDHHNVEDIYKDKFPFKKLDYIAIEYKDATNKYTLKIGEDKSLFNSADALQEKLDETLAVTTYVKELEIKGTNHNWNLGANGRQITVGSLRLFDAKNIVETVKQIEVGHLKEIQLERPIKKKTTKKQQRIEKEEDERLFDLPQVIGALTLTTWEYYIREDQFFNLNSINLRFFGMVNGCITTQHVNTILKHRVANLNLHEYTVHVDSIDHEFEIILEGLDVFSQERGETDSVFVINSPYPEYQLLVEIHNENVLARRIKRGQGWTKFLIKMYAD